MITIKEKVEKMNEDLQKMITKNTNEIKSSSRIIESGINKIKEAVEAAEIIDPPAEWMMDDGLWNI